MRDDFASLQGSRHSASKMRANGLKARSGYVRDPGSSRRAGAHELVDDRIHQRLERGVDDVGRDADRGPALAGLVLALDQHPRHRLGAAVEDAYAIIGELEPLDVALVLAEVLAQREVERVDRADAFG